MNIKPCEICNITYGGFNLKKGSHIICKDCLKKLKVWKITTIQKNMKGVENITKKLNLKKENYKDILLKERMKHKKRIIFYDIILERLKKIKYS